MIAEAQLADYSVGAFRAQSRRLALVPDYSVDGEMVKKLRIRNRMTQEKLRQRAGVAKQTITRMETGSVTPLFETIERVADALGVDAATLIKYPDSENGD